ncbi:hypothetical protein FOTG_18426 [Fusarium oxysporum f. sp. vasinfectum 25433]|uniref:Uncharacterized protein n=1 Tax=Fusarium oxysporum f. sp. vasinfectum 25433 TaxID=1089449 RepID=X0KHY0_FUSOX|nr:hypothetical protein FOTG_18426 [Fusarium oxysporum f. sp. vasinfectum 25433]
MASTVICGSQTGILHLSSSRNITQLSVTTALVSRKVTPTASR